MAQHKPETFLLSPGAESSLPQQAQIALQQVDNLKYFLISAPVDWHNEQCIRRFLLPTGDYVSCVLWSNLFHITGTDIVRCLAFRFQAFGRPVKNPKKFEEGIFSDLRNLKAGTDASLEEPKSPFLDFLYKNNCIRTQKKQKVFYWYSVPHDRLFLDALERDLKREKMGQESTTSAVSEPALSFEFDSSQSLFEQLTKSQQANTSTFPGPQQTAEYAAPTAMHTSESVPPPQMVSHAMQHTPEEALNDMSSYSQMTMPMTATSMPPPLAPTTNPMQSEQMPPQLFYDRNGVPVAHTNQRHSSMPAAFMESSPAPSFVSSQSYYDDYSTRGVSYEPMTPPQHPAHYTPEPRYAPADEFPFYAPGAEMQQPLGQSTYHQPLQQYQASPRSHPAGSMYSHIEGSPTYKQRRRRSSLNAGFAAASVAAQAAMPKVNHAVRRPSDLRRSVSASIPPQDDRSFARAASLPMTYQAMPSFHSTPDVSRQGTPLPSVEDQSQMQERYGAVMDDGFEPMSAGTDYPVGPGVFRRARSATTNDVSPYPHKAHTCPIPTCGRTFKRLEHLKRHVRTHTQDRPYVCSYCNKSFSRSDNLAQHRRTHESMGDISYGGDLVDGFAEADDITPVEEEEQFTSLATNSSVSPDHGYLQGPIDMSMPTMTTMSEFEARASMPPPPLPLSVQGY